MNEGGLQAVASRVRAALDARNDAREKALRRCRETIQASSRAIRAVHRRQFDEANEWIDKAGRSVAEVRDALSEYPDVYHTGYVNDAQKEYVEAEAVRAMVVGDPFPTPEELGVEHAAYLNGLAEAGSECRRYVLDRLREGDLTCAERLLSLMDDIYGELITFDYPDALTAGLRRTTDAFRAVLERTRGDLTLTSQQQALRRALLDMGRPE